MWTKTCPVFSLKSPIYLYRLWSCTNESLASVLQSPHIQRPPLHPVFLPCHMALPTSIWAWLMKVRFQWEQSKNASLLRWKVKHSMFNIPLNETLTACSSFPNSLSTAHLNVPTLERPSFWIFTVDWSSFSVIWMLSFCSRLALLKNHLKFTGSLPWSVRQWICIDLPSFRERGRDSSRSTGFSSSQVTVQVTVQKSKTKKPILVDMLDRSVLLHNNNLKRVYGENGMALYVIKFEKIVDLWTAGPTWTKTNSRVRTNKRIILTDHSGYFLNQNFWRSLSNGMIPYYLENSSAFEAL